MPKTRHVKCYLETCKDYKKTKTVVACQNATILLAGVGGPSDPTIARGNITSQLKHLELARKSTTSHVYATRPPCHNILRDAHFEIFQFCLFVSSVSSFFYRFTFGFLLSFLLWKLCQPFRGGWNNMLGP
jgi:hypothetical protein